MTEARLLQSELGVAPLPCDTGPKPMPWNYRLMLAAAPEIAAIVRMPA
jgi:hypothetical protein